MKKFFGDVKSYILNPAFIVAVLLILLLLAPLILPFARKWLAKVPVVGPAVAGPAALMLTLCLALSLGSGTAHAFDAHLPAQAVQASFTTGDGPNLLSLPPLATVAPVELWLPVAAGCFVVACVLVALRRWLKSHLLPIGGLAAFLFILTVNAAVNVRRDFTALILRPVPEGNAESDTNYLTLYHANGTNFFRVGTNCVPIFFGGAGTLTGTTASIVATQAGGIALTARFVNGLLVSTNGQQLTF